LGNESGMGQNFVDMADIIRVVDPTRPIHYEGRKPLYANVTIEFWYHYNHVSIG